MSDIESIQKLEVRPYKLEQHYAIAHDWWIDHGWTPLPSTHLPPIGFLVYFADVPVCAGWLYRTDSPIAMMEWVVANPEIKGPLRADALDLLIDTCKQTAKQLGHTMVLSWCHNDSLAQRYAKHHFIKGDTGLTSLVYSEKISDNLPQ